MKALGEVARFTENPSALIEFYQKFFGLKPSWKSKDAAEFELEGVRFFVHKKNLPGGSPGEDHLAFIVDDVDAACRELKKRGLSVDRGPRDYYWGKPAYLKDPDGRWLELHRRRSQR
jgi:catechol 2,3-dioxygenase-like lactoylglutathione lyase family enzyme